MGWGASDWAPTQAAALPDLSQQPRARCLLPCPGAERSSGCLCQVGNASRTHPSFIFPSPAVPGEVPRHPALQVRQPAPHPARDVLRRPREEPRPRRRSAALFLLPLAPFLITSPRRTAPSFLRIPIGQTTDPKHSAASHGRDGTRAAPPARPQLCCARGFGHRGGLTRGCLAAGCPLLFPSREEGGVEVGGGRHACTRWAGVTAVSLLNFIEVSCCCLVWKALRGVSLHAATSACTGGC